ncbi:MAG TPA: RIP metalloprotease RseP [Polyangiaceae bacterium]|nr:RIP metalloprotease RseP [Polyangiaceae bacterium]
MDLLYFTLLVSVLVFVHELGHFSLAKIFGVKVLTFSLGFGPKIVRLRGKETEYCIGILPFGGFVNMLEQSKGTGPIPPEDRPRTFEAQALWKRIAIVLAGPAMNVLFPVVLYTSVFMGDRELLPPTVGVVLPGHPADGKLLPGDRILAVDDRDVSSFVDIQRYVAKRAGKPVRFSVMRDGKKADVTVVPNDDVEVQELDMVEHIGRIGILPSFPAPVIGVPRVDSPAYRAGLRTFDRITSINGRSVDRMIDLASALSQNKGEAMVIAYLRPQPVPEATNGLCDLALLDPQVATVTPLPKMPGAKEETATDRAADAFARTGIESSEMYAVFVPEGSSEWKAGLRPGDRITALDGVPQSSWQQLQGELMAGRSRMRDLEWTREGESLGGSFQVQSEQWRDEFGTPYERFVFRTTHWAPLAPDELVPNDSRLTYAVSHGFEETARAVTIVSVGMLRIVQGRVSLTSSMSGPITLYDIAGRAGAKGGTYFATAMALVSINLGLINLLPIPVLDGGHLAFFFVEGLRRKPVARRTREIASLVGVTMLVVLMGLAFKNDVQRRWGDIVSQVHELFS